MAYGSFRGYFIKVISSDLPNGYEILPNKYICNFKITPDRRTDKDSYVDGNGKLVRGILPHLRSGFTFDTGYITDNDIPYLSNIFNGRDRIDLEFWHPISQSYKRGNFYIPDMELEVLMAVGNLVYYKPVQFEMIEY